ncbi:MAG: hypothetical protein H6Q60_1177 [Oscillospiraceae bacterium]|nr:hypothetical protein [Oscillospiraceae bacterium]
MFEIRLSRLRRKCFKSSGGRVGNLERLDWEPLCCAAPRESKKKRKIWANFHIEKIEQMIYYKNMEFHSGLIDADTDDEALFKAQRKTQITALI